MPQNLFKCYDGTGPDNRYPVTERINRAPRERQLAQALVENGAWRTDAGPHTSVQTVVLATSVAGPSWVPATIDVGPVES